MGAEDYPYCIEKANGILSMHADSKRLILLIGDGEGIPEAPGALAACAWLCSSKILAHSLVIRKAAPVYFRQSIETGAMHKISSATGGRVEDEDIYLEALDEIVRLERENYFAVF